MASSPYGVCETGCDVKTFSITPGHSDDVILYASGGGRYIFNMVPSNWGSLTTSATNGASIQVRVGWLSTTTLGSLNLGANTELNGGYNVYVSGHTNIAGSTSLNYESSFDGGLTVQVGGNVGLNGATTLHVGAQADIYGSLTGPDASLKMTGTMNFWYGGTFQIPLNMQGGAQLYIKGGPITTSYIESYGSNWIYCDPDSPLLILDGYKSHGAQLQLLGDVSIWNLIFLNSGNTITTNIATAYYTSPKLTLYGSSTVQSSDSPRIIVLDNVNLNIYHNSAPAITWEIHANVRVNVPREFTFFNLRVVGNGCVLDAVRNPETDYGTIAINTLSWPSDLTIINGVTLTSPLTVSSGQTLTITGDGSSDFMGSVSVLGTLTTSGSVTFHNSLTISGAFTTQGDASYQSFYASQSAAFTINNGENVFHQNVIIANMLTGTGGSALFMSGTNIPNFALSGDFFASFTTTATVTISNLNMVHSSSVDFNGVTTIYSLTMTEDTNVYLSTSSNIVSSNLRGNAYILLATGNFQGSFVATDSAIIHVGTGVVHFLNPFDSSSDDDAIPTVPPRPTTTFVGSFVLSVNATFEITTDAVATISSPCTVGSGSRLDISGVFQIASTSLDVMGFAYVGLWGQLDVANHRGAELNVISFGSLLAHGSVVANGPVMIGYTQSNDASNFTGVIHTGSTGTVTVGGLSLLMVEGTSSFRGQLSVQDSASFQLAPLALVDVFPRLTMSTTTVLSGSLNAIGGYTQSAGTLMFQGGSMYSESNTLVINSGATLSGSGTLNAQTTINGVLQVDAGGVLTVWSSITMSRSSVFNLMVASADSYGVVSLIRRASATVSGGSFAVQFLNDIVFGSFACVRVSGSNARMSGSFGAVSAIQGASTSLAINGPNLVATVTH